MPTVRFLVLLCLASIGAVGADVHENSEEAEPSNTSMPLFTSESRPTTIGVTTINPTTVKEQQIVEFFTRHIEEVANISERLVVMESIVARQARLIAMNKESTQMWMQYLPWKASLSSQNETLRAVGYLVERHLKDFREDLEQAKTDLEQALEEHEACANLHGPHWKSVCDALERNVEKVSAKLQREETRARSWEETASIVHRQKADLDSVDTARIDGLFKYFRRLQRLAEEELLEAAKTLPAFGWSPHLADVLEAFTPDVHVAYEVATEEAVETTSEETTATEEEPGTTPSAETAESTPEESASTGVESAEEDATSTSDDETTDDEDSLEVREIVPYVLPPNQRWTAKSRERFINWNPRG